MGLISWFTVGLKPENNQWGVRFGIVPRVFSHSYRRVRLQARKVDFPQRKHMQLLYVMWFVDDLVEKIHSCNFSHVQYDQSGSWLLISYDCIASTMWNGSFYRTQRCRNVGLPVSELEILQCGTMLEKKEQSKAKRDHQKDTKFNVHSLESF